MKPKIEEELHHQEKLGALERVDTTEWATPVVPVIKPTGATRLCGDYKVSVNPHLEVNKYPYHIQKRHLQFLMVVRNLQNYIYQRHICKFHLTNSQEIWL